MKQITLPDNFAADWRPTDYTARRHAQLMGDRERLTGAHAEAIDALRLEVADLRAELNAMRELLHLVMSERMTG